MEKPATSAAIAWLIVLNKPFYPLYIWWIAPHGLAIAALMLLSAPFFLMVALKAKTGAPWLRAALPVLGLADTLLATWIFGAGGGAGLFLVPCALLAAMAFTPSGYRWTRGLGVAVALAGAGLLATNIPPLHTWSAAETARIFALNAWSVLGLSSFILWKFASVKSRV